MSIVSTAIQTCMASSKYCHTTKVDPKVITVKSHEINNMIPYDWEVDDPFGSYTPERLGGKLKEPVDTYKPKYIESKTKPFSRSSKKQRNYHNIHQPGRTNCNQRYQKKI